MTRQRVYVWGFDEAEVQGWPPELEPVSTEEWPAEGPVVVHRNALERFQAEALAHPRPDGRLPDAVLYLPPDAEAPQEAWAYFDATVRAGEWDKLKELAACPRQFEMAGMADELPAAFLEGLDCPVDELDPAMLPLRGELVEPLPDAVKEHLAACPTCRKAFNESLEGRLRTRRLLLCPGAERLAAYVRGAADTGVEHHLESCRVCQAQVAVLRRVLARTWLEIPLPRVPAMADLLGSALREAGDRVAQDAAAIRQMLVGIVARLINGSLQAQMVPVGDWARARRATGPVEENELATLLQHLQEGREVTLLRPHRDLTLGWDEARQEIWIDNLHGAGKTRIHDFRMELRRGDEVLWSGASQQGRAQAPLAELGEALQNGADQLVILAVET